MAKTKATLYREKWMQRHGAQVHAFTLNRKRMYYCCWHELPGWYKRSGPEASTPVQAIKVAMELEGDT